MLKYKANIMSELEKAGYNSTRIRRESIFSQSTLTKFRNNIVCGASELNKLCALLSCQPGDILEYIPDQPVTDPKATPLDI